MAGEHAIFAPTLSFELLRMLSHAVTGFPGELANIFDPDPPDRFQIIVLDISRAYSDAVTPDDDPTYLEPPELNAEPGTCAL